MSQTPHYTAAMARLFAQQGYLRRAAEIYRHLIQAQADSADLREALQQLERQIAQSPSPTRKDAELMMREWAALVKKSHSGNRNPDLSEE